MFWAFFDPQADSHIDCRERDAQTIDLPHAGKRSTPTTADQLLFLLENPDRIDNGRSAPVIH